MTMQHLQPNTTLQGGKYRIERVLGQGGFGITYLAVQTSDNRQVAIKELFLNGVNERVGTVIQVSNSANDTLFEKQKEKFKKEAKRIMSLDNEHIVKVYDLFEENNTVYYVMDYLKGESLASKMKREGHPLTESEVMDILPQLLDALSEIHQYQIWHLDIKPANIMLVDNNIVLIDFGASKQITPSEMTSTALYFTPGYAPAEQTGMLFKQFGPWTDLYAVGATIFNLLTSKSPLDFDIEEFKEDDLPESNLGLMYKLINWMMQPKRKDRPQRAVDVKQRFYCDLVSIGVISIVNEALNTSVVKTKGTDIDFVKDLGATKDQIDRIQKEIEDTFHVEVEGLPMTHDYVCIGILQQLGWIFDTGEDNGETVVDDVDDVDEFENLLKEQNEILEERNGQTNKVNLRNKAGVNYSDSPNRADAFSIPLNSERTRYKITAQKISDVHDIILEKIDEGSIKNIVRETRVPKAIVLFMLGYILRELKYNDSFRKVWKCTGIRNDGNAIDLNYIYLTSTDVYRELKKANKGITVTKIRLDLGLTIEATLIAIGWLYKDNKLTFVNDSVVLNIDENQNDNEVNTNKNTTNEDAEELENLVKEQNEILEGRDEETIISEGGKGNNNMTVEEMVTLINSDNKKGLETVRGIANSGNADAQLLVGIMYQMGVGGEEHQADAAYYFRMAAEQGIASAQTNLGKCYLAGDGVPEDDKKAFEWFKKAAEQDDPDGQYLLGACYSEGTGVTKDYYKAFMWIRKAAKQGLAIAQYNLGICFMNGLGVAANKVKAKNWLQKAAEQGYEDAPKVLQYLDQQTNQISNDKNNLSGDESTVIDNIVKQNQQAIQEFPPSPSSGNFDFFEDCLYPAAFIGAIIFGIYQLIATFMGWPTFSTKDGIFIETNLIPASVGIVSTIVIACFFYDDK